nr:class I SAM-dependent methyltransferase [Clostridiales bacterium]
SVRKKAFLAFMNKGGVFIFDVNTPYKHREILKDNTFVYETDEVFCVWQNKLDKETDEVEIQLDFFENNEDDLYERTQECFCERAYSEESLTKMLEESGFEILGIYEEMTTQKPKENTQREVFAVRKL